MVRYVTVRLRCGTVRKVRKPRGRCNAAGAYVIVHKHLFDVARVVNHAFSGDLFCCLQFSALFSSNLFRPR